MLGFLQCTVKPALSSHSKRRPKIGFQDRFSLNAGPREHYAILSNFIKLAFVFKTFVLSIFSGCSRQVLLYHFYYFFLTHSFISDLFIKCMFLCNFYLCSWNYSYFIYICLYIILLCIVMLFKGHILYLYHL